MDYTEILINIRKILRSINLESKRIQKEYGISIPQYLCLNFLQSQEEYNATLTEIKNHLNLNASTVTGIITRLEARGYIAKLPNQNDKRSSKIYLTALGEKAVNSVPDLMHEKLTRKLKDLSDAELTQVKQSLDILVNLMEVNSVDASPLVISDEKIGQQE
jgi:DNA-binding MarR family transcriptional regulator